jgi:hypothetical protein
MTLTIPSYEYLVLLSPIIFCSILELKSLKNATEFRGNYQTYRAISYHSSGNWEISSGFYTASIRQSCGSYTTKIRPWNCHHTASIRPRYGLDTALFICYEISIYNKPYCIHRTQLYFLAVSKNPDTKWDRTQSHFLENVIQKWDRVPLFLEKVIQKWDSLFYKIVVYLYMIKGCVSKRSIWLGLYITKAVNISFRI